jgi:Ca-activated chloride channel family protein
MEIIFKQPIYLWFLISIFLLILVHLFTLKYVRRRALKFANFEAIARVTGKQILSQNVSLLAIRILTLILVVLALSGTTIQYVGQSSDFDFVLAIDSSSSMSSDDFNPNRLEAAKREAINFVNSLSAKTKVGIVSFSGISLIEQDLTDDLDMIKDSIKKIKISEVGGTDLGEAIVTSSNLLIKSDRAKVIILLTDGQSNVGIPVEEAIAYAFSYQIIIYPIGIATEKGGRIAGVETVSKINENTLNTIAFNTDGTYYRATDQQSLADAYKKVASSTRESLTIDLTMLLMTLALLLLFVEWALVNTKYRTIP